MVLDAHSKKLFLPNSFILLPNSKGTPRDYDVELIIGSSIVPGLTDPPTIVFRFYSQLPAVTSALAEVEGGYIRFICVIEAKYATILLE
ncbi:uncharacterized protein RSE6_13432 [Rhynchosporium secalis]|uniref:Uncharacterized protein n=1 Tax=Rhynchosporium secalis TaxID=38038 RepID=A0A1E1MSV2_RHYSE|nr:uncharacterized protein RSE6_13432 [Rhynchosporium secalis]